ncbi:MAG: hypothetical protein HY248_04405, partial [Fimbriimonas ginsengisoli]|nr:hypothetical protein [Fimbriimonas ginsengisoli]
MTVTVISTDPNVLVPTYLTVPTGSVNTSFAAKVLKASDTAKSATLYAVAEGVSTNTQITLLPPPVMAGLRCTPTSVVTPGTTTCTLNVTDPAPLDGVRISLMADNSAVIVPAQVLIPYRATTATFTATLNAVATDTPANIEMPGAGPQPIMLLAPPAVSVLTCDTPVLAGGGSTNCTVLMAKPVKGGGLNVLLSASNTAALSVPASVNVPVGFNKASFKVVALASAPIGPVAVTATTIVTSQSFVVSIRPHGSVTSVSCNPSTLTGGGTTTCQANISPAAPLDGTTFTVTTGSSTIFAPPTVQVPPGAQSAQFTVTAPLIKADETAAITVNLDTSIVAQLQLVALRPVSVNCAPKVVASGSPINCQVSLNSSTTDQVGLTLSSNNASVLVPALVTTQAGLITLNFQATTKNVTGKQDVTLAASYQGVSAGDKIQLMPAGPAIKVPSSITVMPGQAVAFNVDVTDPAGLA